MWVCPKTALALSSFFSLHRPISVTHSFPKTISDDAFAAIFRPRPRSSRVSDVISTLSRTVESLEQPMARLTITKRATSDAEHGFKRNGIGQANETASAEDDEASIQAALNSMSGQFLPFNPPPPPTPLGPPYQEAIPAAEGEGPLAALLREHERQQQPDEEVDDTEDAHHLLLQHHGELDANPKIQRRVYKAFFTIEEATDDEGNTSILAHSPRLVEDADGAESAGPSEADGGPGGVLGAIFARAAAAGAAARQNQTRPSSFLERMALRQMRFEESMAQRLERSSTKAAATGSSETGDVSEATMLALSVVRRRRLKIKKKKYKKLMKRTRNLRRKLDRT